MQIRSLKMKGAKTNNPTNRCI